MTATYLAQEAIELLHFQNDSVYLQCLKRKGACTDLPEQRIYNGSPGGDETTGEQAWRIFKDRISGEGGPVSCFTGCAYDFFDMSNVTSTPLQIYLTNGVECSTLSRATIGVTINGVSSVRSYYACSGVGSHLAGAYKIEKTTYSRTIKVESINTFELEGDGDPSYYDDLLITATITFRRSTGQLRTIVVTDFLRSRT
jgi:hypothetical protein